MAEIPFSPELWTLADKPDAYHLKIVLILTVGFAFASILGYLSRLAKLSPLLGYLVAGYIIGPYSPGFVADAELADQLAEIGVVLMMFGVGLHFKLEDLIKVQGIAIPGAILQTALSTAVGALLSQKIGWSVESGVVIGLAVGVASTVVLVRILSDNDLLSSPQGHVAVGWLIVEDVLTVGALLLIPPLAQSANGGSFSVVNLSFSLVWVIIRFLLLVAIIFTLGRRLVVFSLVRMARTRSHELFTLSVLALTFVIATGSALLFGTSIALGAFIAGMVIGRTDVSHQVSANSLPLRDVFVVIFFLSVGMLFDPIAIANNVPLFFGILGIVLLLKPFAALAIALAFQQNLRTALTVAVGLAQIGEFSFILAEEAMKYKILPDAGYDMIVACALVSIALNPVLFKLITPIERWLGRGVEFDLLTPKMEQDEDKSSIIPQAIVVGFGPIGQSMVKTLGEMGFSTVVIDHNVDTISRLKAENKVAIYGDAAVPEILEDADIRMASILIITVPEVEANRNIITMARSLNPVIRIVARTRYLSEQAKLANLSAEVICGEETAIKAFEAAVLKSSEAEANA